MTLASQYLFTELLVYFLDRGVSCVVYFDRSRHLFQFQSSASTRAFRGYLL